MECTWSSLYQQSLLAQYISRTASPKITFTMREVMKNQQLIGIPGAIINRMLNLTYSALRFDDGLTPRPDRRHQISWRAPNRTSRFAHPRWTRVRGRRVWNYESWRSIWENCYKNAQRAGVPIKTVRLNVDVLDDEVSRYQEIILCCTVCGSNNIYTLRWFKSSLQSWGISNSKVQPQIKERMVVKTDNMR